jgi:hypothetical protein
MASYISCDTYPKNVYHNRLILIWLHRALDPLKQARKGGDSHG